MKFGYGFAPAHHGEMLQGFFRSSGGFRQGLISLPCDIFWSEASFYPNFSGTLAVRPAGKWKARRAAEIALGRLGMKGAGGRLLVRGRVPEKLGLGSSTSDVVAAARSVASAFKASFSPDELAAIAVEAERAADPIAYGERFVHFAQREGRVLDDLPYPMPAFEIVGFNAAPSGGGVDTLDMTPPSYEPAEIDMYEDLLGLFRRGMKEREPALVAEVATESAKLNQRRLRLEGFDLLAEMVSPIGALGLQIAHSGSVAGFLFPPGAADGRNVMHHLAVLRDEIGVDEFWRFRVGSKISNQSAALSMM